MKTNSDKIDRKMAVTIRDVGMFRFQHVFNVIIISYYGCNQGEIRC